MTETYIRAERKCSMDAALALLEIGLPVDIVASYTQLAVEEVEQLRQAGDLPEDIRNIDVRHCGLDENETAKLRSRRMYLTDLVSNFATAKDRRERRSLEKDRIEGRAEGRVEGRAKGRAERNLEIARNALQMKLPVPDIAKLTGLTCEEVERLRMEEIGQI